MAPPPGPLTVPQLETWLWAAACAIRGATDAPKYKDFILPLVFFKRLDDVYHDELRQKADEFGGAELAREVVQADHAAALKEGRPPIVRFVVPETYGWHAVRNFTPDTEQEGHRTLGEFLTTCLREVSRLNPDLHGVLDVKDFAETQAGQRTLDDERLATLVEVISRHRLGLQDTAPDVLGQAYEYLLRKFAEGQGQSAGEFYTPAEVGLLLAELLEVPARATVYDPTCGSGGLLIKARLSFERRNAARRAEGPQLFGQELNPVTYAIARMNMLLHDFTGARIVTGDTMRRPGFGAAGAGLMQFDRVVANPMWNQKNFPDSLFETDSWGRFPHGAPPSASADWAWVQHIVASLKPGGRAAVVLDTGAVSRGSGSGGSSRERDVRKALVDEDLVEAVVLLPENLFYNTTAPGIVLLLRKDKPQERREQVLLLNASQHFVKRKPKNELTLDGRQALAAALTAYEDVPKLARRLTLAEVQAADYNLSPSQFVETGDRATHRSLVLIRQELQAAADAREAADARLQELLAGLNLEGGETV
ncbi:DNA methyltransferase [Hymenobacter crusticola]|uniref:site-specific DNA-methyltransferase (adenine-specific) n=1 Tax=Hymenobacter crusticola TaxID=1770526 RepID=A0A243W677_9BACT|nr:DNA methyltransferase [Hymenobacter crusticola]